MIPIHSPPMKNAVFVMVAHHRKRHFKSNRKPK